jgi:tripartite-type tricarboxylate transporter receptor subunit TctC
MIDIGEKPAARFFNESLDSITGLMYRHSNSEPRRLHRRQGAPMTSEANQMVNKRRLLVGMAAAAAVPWLAGRASAQAGYPNRPVRLIIPSAAGGSPDILARLFQPRLQDALGQPVVVEDVPGAAGIIGTDKVAKATPDGYTLLYGHQQVVTINQVTQRNLPYQPERDLAPISTTLELVYAWIATPSFPANTVPEWLKLAREQPGAISYASTGAGSAAHLGGVLVERAAGIKLLHVPYRGNTNSDLLAGVVQLRLESLAAAMALIQSGKVKALAVATPKRLAVLPDVPSITEFLPGCEMPGFHGFWAPAKTPAPILARLNAEIVKILQLPDVRKRIGELGFLPQSSTQEDMAARIRAETQQWAALVKSTGMVFD